MPAPIRRSTLPLVVCAVALVIGHVALVDHFEPLAWLWSRTPITGVDFDTHAEQTWRVLEGLEGWGKGWVYDVQLQAGFPTGTIFDADNKLWELWTFALHRLGLSKAAAFNSFVFVAHFLILPWLYVSARIFGLGAGRALVASTLGALLWFFDSYAHWFWWIGTVAYIFAAYFYLLPLALFYRFGREKKLWQIALVALLLTLAHLLHPYSFFVLALPMLVVYLRAWRGFAPKHHVSVLCMCAVVVIANAYWLRAALQHWHYILDSAFFGQSHLGFIVADLFNVLLDASTTGYIGTRASFRWLSVAAACGTLYFWRKERDDRYVLFLASFVWMFSLAYIAPVVIPPVRQIQPYRFVASAMFLSVFPAAELIGRFWRERREIAKTASVRVLLFVAAMLGIQHFAAEIVYYVPGILPQVPAVREAPFPIAGTGYGPHFEYRHLKPSLVDMQVDRWIDQHAHEGRFAVPDWTGERYAWSTRAQILGGFVDLNMMHARAHPMRWADRARPSAAQLRAYIDTYAVRYFIVRFDDFGLPEHPDLVSLVERFGDVMIYRAHQPANFFAQGSGEVEARTNRLSVTNSDPAVDVVLKYHWHEALVCKPGCRVQRTHTELDEVGFIRVPAPHPADFVIENSYQM